jgi:hypothetical protein
MPMRPHGPRRLPIGCGPRRTPSRGATGLRGCAAGWRDTGADLRLPRQRSRVATKPPHSMLSGTSQGFLTIVRVSSARTVSCTN